MTRQPVPKDENRFARFAPEKLAQFPPGYTSPMKIQTAREIAEERWRQDQHWTTTVPAWIQKKLRALFFRST